MGDQRKARENGKSPKIRTNGKFRERARKNGKLKGKRENMGHKNWKMRESENEWEVEGKPEKIGC